MLESLSWTELEARHSGQWVELVECDWPEGHPHPVSGIVRAHSEVREEFFLNLRTVPSMDSTIVFIGQPTKLGELGLGNAGLEFEAADSPST